MARKPYPNERPELWRRVNMRLAVLGIGMVELLEQMNPGIGGGAARATHRTRLHEVLNGLRPQHPDYMQAMASALALSPADLQDGAPWEAISRPAPAGWASPAQSMSRRRKRAA
jgi:hypothetical protein